MSDSRFYYYSTYHLARDLVGTAAPVTVVVLISVLLFEPARGLMKSATQIAVEQTSWLALAYASVAYLLVAFITGIMANRLFFVGRAALRRIRREDGKETLGITLETRRAINSLYARYIVMAPKSLETSTDFTPEYLSRLCHFFRLYNLAGFHHFYREYTFLFIYRQLVVYSFGLLAVCLAQSKLWESAGLAIVLLAALGALKEGRRDALEGACQFIFATASWLENQSQGVRGALGGVGSPDTNLVPGQPLEVRE